MIHNPVLRPGMCRSHKFRGQKIGAREINRCEKQQHEDGRHQRKFHQARSLFLVQDPM
jgi:hypothetical protein